jgi:hypothetical protein
MEPQLKQVEWPGWAKIAVLAIIVTMFVTLGATLNDIF